MDIQWFKDLGSLANTGNFSQAAELNNISLCLLKTPSTAETVAFRTGTGYAG